MYISKKYRAKNQDYFALFAKFIEIDLLWSIFGSQNNLADWNFIFDRSFFL